MTWSGDVHFGDLWAAFRGRAGDNSLHAHPAAQLVFGHGEPAQVETHAGDVVAGEAIWIPPNLRHAVRPARILTLILIEPESALSRALSGSQGRAKIAIVQDAARPFISADAPLGEIMAPLLGRHSPGRHAIDPRLALALRHLETRADGRHIARAARRVGLSPSRLRALADRDLGAPLVRWLAWSRLRRAALAMARGGGLAAAAAAGGFADQAHYSRTMRKLMGIAPGAAKTVAGS